MRRDLRDRLERFERRTPPPPEPPSPQEREGAGELLALHFKACSEGGTLEDVPEQHRDAETWSNMETYGPVMLRLEQKGLLGGSGELPAADADLCPADDSSEVVDGRPDSPDQDASGKLP